MCIKPWLPHVRIIEPADVKEAILSEIKGWVRWQGKI
jgi:hypothetical protein